MRLTMKKSTGRGITAALFFLLVLPFPSVLCADEFSRALSVLKQAQVRCEALKDYTLTLEKQELVKGRLSPPETMFVKWKRPFCVYIKTMSGKHKEREIIYVKGKNNDKMIVSPGGILGALTVRISPDSALAKRESRHTITEAGLPSIISRMISTIQDEDRPGSPAKVTYVGEESCSPERVIHLSIENSSYAPRTDIRLSTGTLFPYSIISYDTDGTVLESYTYRDIKTNVGLTDADFDPKNPAYRF
jgi:hypothetical protein